MYKVYKISLDETRIPWLGPCRALWNCNLDLQPLIPVEVHYMEKNHGMFSSKTFNMTVFYLNIFSNVIDSCVLLNIFVQTISFIDSLINRKIKRTALFFFFYIFITLQMPFLSLLINWMCPCSIKVLTAVENNFWTVVYTLFYLLHYTLHFINPLGSTNADTHFVASSPD